MKLLDLYLLLPIISLNLIQDGANAADKMLERVMRAAEVESLQPATDDRLLESGHRWFPSRTRTTPHIVGDPLP